MEEISKLQEIPQKLSESLGNCKAVNEEIFSTFKVVQWKISFCLFLTMRMLRVFMSFEQGFAEDEKSATANLFSKTSEFVMSLMSSFEAQIYMAMNGFRKADDEKESSYSEESKKKYKVAANANANACWTHIHLSRSYMPIFILFTILIFSYYLS